MFRIPYTFSNENENYITIPALKRFAREKRNEDLKTTVDRPQLIKEIEDYANQSEEKREVVLDWLDHVLAEGIKEVQIKYIDDSLMVDYLRDPKYVEKILEPKLADSQNRHLFGRYEPYLQLFRYETDMEGDVVKGIKLYLGKLISTFDKEKSSAVVLYPIYVEIYLEEGLIVGRSKSKSGMYRYMKEFDLEKADSITAEKELSRAISWVCELFGINTVPGIESRPKFKRHLFYMLEQYTKTPREIQILMENKQVEIQKMVDTIMNEICELSESYRSDVESNILNMVEKYFSINYPDKEIFTRNREAYPLRLNATDEEESKVEQTSAMEEPLQSKAVFFDNKKMLQKNESCDGVLFMFKRINTLYCEKQFKVRINISKDFCTLKFTEYTMEEDIIHVLFSLINSKGVTE